MDTTKVLEQASMLEKCGMTEAAAQMKAKAERAGKLAMAYEHYRYVSQETIDAFIAKLKAATEKWPTLAELKESAGPFMQSLKELEYRRNPGAYCAPSYDTLSFDAAEKYAGCPPTDVLEKMVEAKTRGCFDMMEIAHVLPVASQVYLPDPIVFGRISGCTDRFFIADWGTDVRITELLGVNEG